MDKYIEMRLYFIVPEIGGEPKSAYRKVFKLTPEQLVEVAVAIEAMGLEDAAKPDTKHTTFTDQDEVKA